MTHRKLAWIIICWILIVLAFWTTVAYVITHFVRKFW